jgi:hypothetical protein
LERITHGYEGTPVLLCCVSERLSACVPGTVLLCLPVALSEPLQTATSVCCACLKDPLFVFLPLGYISVIGTLTASDARLSDSIITMCVCVRMQPGMVYVQWSELWASCVIWLTSFAMSVPLLIQMIWQLRRVEPEPAVIC